MKLRTKLTKTKKITRRRQWFIREEGVTKYPLSGDLKIYRIGREGAKGERTSVFFWDFLVLTLHYPGCEMVLVMIPPLKSAKMKLQGHVTCRNRVSWVCPIYLDYLQVVDMCISCVFTWF